ncbi:MAG: LacI family DNA-binding transcriptional regulator [Lentisphaeria bacterium]
MNTRKKKTVAAVGRLAGCSGGTVSRVVNNSGYVSPDTRKAVLAAIKATGYVPKAKREHPGAPAGHARRTAKKVIEVIATRNRQSEDFSMEDGQAHFGPLTKRADEAILPDIIDHGMGFHRQIIFGIVEEIRRLGYKTVLQATSNLADNQFLAEVNVADKCGVLLVGEHSPVLDTFVARCKHPLVLVDMVGDSRADVVTTDNFYGTRILFDYLHSLGHRKLGYVGGPAAGHQERFASFKLCMIEADLAIRPEWISIGPNHFATTVENARTLLDRPNRPTAILCCNDVAALAVMRVAGQLGIAVPQQLSIAGFDDVEAATLVNPPLTTLRVRTAELGREAVQRLVMQIQNGQPPRTDGCRVLFRPELVIRQSTARPA